MVGLVVAGLLYEEHQPFNELGVADQVLVAYEHVEDVVAGPHSEFGDLVGTAQEGGESLAERGEIGRVLEQETRSRRDLGRDPPTLEATTAFCFHMPSATVSPKPSARLFCTITVA